MEIADNQHPIDLSRKCGYYEKSQHYLKKPSPAVSSSRPLPDLIPISSLLHDTSKSKKDVSRSPFAEHAKDYSQYGVASKERSVVRKELARQRSMPHLAGVSKMRKSNSDTRIPFLRTDSPPEHSFFLNCSSVPTHHSSITASNGVRKYADKGLFYNSSCLTSTNRIDFRYVDDEVSLSLHSQSKKYIKQGPGVSLSTIQSLRKLLDKRKSMQKE